MTLPKILSMEGRRVLVTGAARGIGAATALALAELRADVVATDVADLDDTVRSITRTGGSVEPRTGDLTDDAFRATLLDSGPFDAMAHVAAVFQGPHDLDFEGRFRRVMDVNLRVTIELASSMVDHMGQRGDGYVVIVGSLAGKTGGTLANDSLDYAAYAASKGGVHAVVRWLSRRAVSLGVRVNGVAPGGVDTPLAAAVTFDPSSFPLGRMGSPEELGWNIALLCTPIAGFTAGAVLDVNGGVWVG